MDTHKGGVTPVVVRVAMLTAHAQPGGGGGAEQVG